MHMKKRTKIILILLVLVASAGSTIAWWATRDAEVTADDKTKGEEVAHDEELLNAIESGQSQEE